MKTEELVAMLARGPIAADRHTTERWLGASALTGAVVAAILLFGLLGARPDLAGAIARPDFWIKLAFPTTLALVAFAATCRLARPGGRLGPARLALAAPFAVAAAFGCLALAHAPAGERGALIAGHSALQCVAFVTLLALPIFAAAFAALRRLAPTRPRAAGACAGLLAGAVAATVYAFHCDETQAPFVAVWYSAGVAIPALIGGLSGPHLLRWN